MSEQSLAAILHDPATIHFVPGTDDADLGELLIKNPQRTPDGFVWFLPDRKTEATITFVGKVIYDSIGDKTGPYFSLPNPFFVEDISADKMAKVKTGFAIRLINRDLIVDALLSDELIDHNQAVMEFFMAIQENADRKLETSTRHHGESTVRIRPFLKVEKGNPFYVIPVVSEPLFPQFKGTNTVGRISLNPHSKQTSKGDNASSCITLGDLPDPLGRYNSLKNNETYRHYQIHAPPVYDINNSLVNPLNYRDTIPDGTLVSVRGKLRMYNIVNDSQALVNRPYQFVFDRIQVINDDMESQWVDCHNSKKRSLSPDGTTLGGPSPKKVAVMEDIDEEL